ncbi:MAG: MATE family efflux transporter [Tenericutes bacterium HGW-Tenericutes-1]|jgi:putative MATE family efflux protein|nr:MAG: MATE family efflux transporter [Tenericutes bacterium HGW-Tenericutes-1]
MKVSNAEMLGKHNIKKVLIQLSIPAILGMVVNALYNFVDTLFVSIGVGEIAIGGLAFAFPVQMIAMAVSLMIGMGSASIFSRAFGRGDTETMKSAVNTALRIALLSSLVMSILGFIFLDDLLIFFGASASNIVYAEDYMIVILIGLAPLSLTMVLNNLTRAEGRAKIAMYSMMIGTGLNIVLDPIFIFDWGFGMGVRGAAIATIISQIVAFIYIFSVSINHKSSLMISLKHFFNIPLKMVKEISIIGLPSFLRNSIGAFLAIIIYRLIGKYTEGDPAIYISIYGVINRVMMFVFMPAFGIIQGMTPIVGFNYGAKNHQRLKSVIRFATEIIMVYFLLGFIFIQLFAESIFSIFSETDNQIFIQSGSEAFKVIALGFLLVGFQIIISSVYQAIGYPLKAMIVAISRQVILFIPLAYILTSLLGLQGLWISFAISDTVAGLLGLGLLIYEMKAIQSRIPKVDIESIDNYTPDVSAI